MNEYFLHVRSNEKLKELRREGITGQEFHRLGGAARPQLRRSAMWVALAILLLGILAISAFLVVPAVAASASVRLGGQPISINQTTHALGVDALLFVRSGSSRLAAQADTCAGVFIPAGC